MRKKGMMSLAIVAALSVSTVAWTQGRGGGGQGGQSRGGPQQGAGQQKGGGEQQRDQQRLRIHATDRQQDQYRTCTQAADRVRTQARAMAQTAKGGGYNNEEFRQQHARLQEQIRLMQQEHERFMQGLSDDQKAGVRERIRHMEQSRERLHIILQTMEKELAQADPNRKQLENQSREMERVMKEWQKCHREMGADLGINQ